MEVSTSLKVTILPAPVERQVGMRQILPFLQDVNYVKYRI